MFKKCPFCKKEISDKAITCPFCHLTLVEKFTSSKSHRINQTVGNTAKKGSKLPQMPSMAEFKRVARAVAQFSYFAFFALAICYWIYSLTIEPKLPPPAVAQTIQTIAPAQADPASDIPIIKPKTPTPTAIDNSVPPPVPHTPVSLANGTVLNRDLPMGLGYIKIDNGTDLDAVAKLVDLSTNSGVFRIYIQAGKTYTMQKIPDGNYKLVFGLGTDWDETTNKFLKNSNYQKFDESFNFNTYTTDDGNYTDTHYATYSVTLNGVIGGTAKTSDISPAEFAGY